MQIWSFLLNHSNVQGVSFKVKSIETSQNTVKGWKGTKTRHFLNEKCRNFIPKLVIILLKVFLEVSPIVFSAESCPLQNVWCHFLYCSFFIWCSKLFDNLNQTFNGVCFFYGIPHFELQTRNESQGDSSQASGQARWHWSPCWWHALETSQVENSLHHSCNVVEHRAAFTKAALVLPWCAKLATQIPSKEQDRMYHWQTLSDHCDRRRRGQWESSHQELLQTAWF